RGPPRLTSRAGTIGGGRDPHFLEDRTVSTEPTPRPPAATEPRPAPAHSLAGKAWLVVKTAQARLRFIVILAAIGLVISNWNLIKAYWDRWTRPAAQAQQASSDHEFY